jgi:hypothetical protein
MNKSSPVGIERAEELLRETRAQLDPDGAPVLHPWRIAARNSTIALALIAVAGVGKLVAYRPLTTNTTWWVWFAVAASVVAVCFAHAALGLVIGRHMAANVLKILLAAFLVGLVFWLTHQGVPAGR